MESSVHGHCRCEPSVVSTCVASDVMSTAHRSRSHASGAVWSPSGVAPSQYENKTGNGQGVAQKRKLPMWQPRALYFIPLGGNAVCEMEGNKSAADRRELK
ncbi:hypothetical protein MRX96_032171 [Rhipicephalus microplus]